MAEDPTAHSELSALTHRFELGQQTTAREFGIVKSDLTAAKIQVGNLNQKVSRLDEKVDQLIEEMRGLNAKILSAKLDRNHARVVELLTALTSKKPNES
ncbi:hypothetical protein Scani_33870 [Streptomyces caniferus]|uniref:Uncharacterized protein n=1 Tax=Streptomyces caniferus TaxID=285557 RepID=A0A640S7A1_9ACTN|nr:hypothetical protein [Streptomyces caniferus]GFE07119.1 hypothetical protein Scani_33870 [Streptomyces caniferus]